MRFKAIAVIFFAVILIAGHAFAAGMSPALHAHYQELRNEIYEGYLSTRNYRNLRFYIAAALHDLSSLQWKVCMNYGKKYGDCNGGVTRELQNLVRSLMAQRSTGSGIQKIYDYVNRTIIYEAESKNVPRFPYETLHSRRGDCEDQAILCWQPCCVLWAMTVLWCALMTIAGNFTTSSVS